MLREDSLAFVMGSRRVKKLGSNILNVGLHQNYRTYLDTYGISPLSSKQKTKCTAAFGCVSCVHRTCGIHDFALQQPYNFVR